MFVDIDTEEVISESDVRERFMPFIYSDVSALTLAKLHSVRAAKLVDKPSPDVKHPYEMLTEKITKITGKWTRSWVVKACSLEDARRYRHAEIELIYQSKKLEPVEYDGKWWTGGYESAQLVKGTIEMREFVGQDHVTLVDTSGETYEYTLNDAMKVALAIASAYEMVRMKKAELTRAINRLESVADLRAVEWV